VLNSIPLVMEKQNARLVSKGPARPAAKRIAEDTKTIAYAVRLVGAFVHNYVTKLK
jgi:hypothetical protein